MSPLDANLLPDLSPDAPTGSNLEADPEFGALERAVQGKPETQYGETRIAATPPEWQQAEGLALGLLERTRDLRVLVHLATARLHLVGLPGFAGVLPQIRELLEARWEQTHPQLDAEDDFDPTLRCNVLQRLRDPGAVLRPLRDLPLAGTARTGRVSWRDIAIQHGTLEPEPGREKLSEAAIRAAFQATDPAEVAARRQAAELAIESTAAIQAAFEVRAPRGALDLTPLAKLLQDILKELRRFEVVAVAPEPEPDPGGVPEEQPGTPAPVASGTASPQRTAPANVRAITAVVSRDDALYLLDLAATYFRAHEPSSPLPLLLDRAQRLATMQFMDILRDLAPDGLGQAQIIAGTPGE